jgi:hypothetical protein
MGMGDVMGKPYRFRFSLLVLVMLSVFFTTVSAQQTSGRLLLQNVTIIDAISDEPLRGYSVLVDGNIISEVLSPGDMPDGNVEVINLEGKYIIPGLIDSHVHWEDWMGELFVNHGVTSVVALTDVDKAMRTKSQTSQGLPRLFHSGNRPSFNADSTQREVRQIIDEWLKKEPEIAHFPTHNEEISKAYAMAAREVQRHGYMIFGHAENAINSLQDGHGIIEHIWAFAQAVMTEQELAEFQRGEHLTFATFMSNHWEELDELIKKVVDNKGYLNPTLVYEWGGMSKDANQREIDDYLTLRDPDLAYFPDNIKLSLFAKHRQIKNYSSRYGNLPMVSKLPEADLAEFKQGFENIKEFIRRFMAAGGKIQAGTDAITAGIPGLGLHQEMHLLVETGLTPMQAIKAATRWSAEQFEGVDGKRGPARVGSIEAGKVADLVVLDKNPLVDIYNSRTVSRVMKDGKWVKLGFHPEYYTFTGPARSIAGSTLAPVISAAFPSYVVAGGDDRRVALEGSGFQMTTLVRVNGISVKTYFINPRRVEFDLPANLFKSSTPDPYRPPGPYQDYSIVGYRGIKIHAYNPPPEGGISNTINLMVRPD